MVLDTFGKRLRAVRQDQRLSQIALRNRMEDEYGVSIGESYISELERTDKMPSLEVAIAMARILDVSLDYLGLLMDDGAQSFHGIVPPAYFSEEADEVAQLLDSMRPEQRAVVIQAVRSFASLANDRSRRAAEMRDLLDSIESEKGPAVRKEFERLLRGRGLVNGS